MWHRRRRCHRCRSQPLTLFYRCKLQRSRARARPRQCNLMHLTVRKFQKPFSAPSPSSCLSPASSLAASISCCDRAKNERRYFIHYCVHNNAKTFVNFLSLVFCHPTFFQMHSNPCIFLVFRVRTLTSAQFNSSHNVFLCREAVNFSLLARSFTAHAVLRIRFHLARVNRLEYYRYTRTHKYTEHTAQNAKLDEVAKEKHGQKKNDGKRKANGKLWSECERKRQRSSLPSMTVSDFRVQS